MSPGVECGEIESAFGAILPWTDSPQRTVIVIPGSGIQINRYQSVFISNTLPGPTVCTHRSPGRNRNDLNL
jgi:hypothetical protein